MNASHIYKLSSSNIRNASIKQSCIIFNHKQRKCNTKMIMIYLFYVFLSITLIKPILSFQTFPIRKERSKYLIHQTTNLSTRNSFLVKSNDMHKNTRRIQANSDASDSKNGNGNGNDSEDEGLSDIDAKVLRSLLDDNLDLVTEENLLQMLERDQIAKQKKAEQNYAKQAAESSMDSESSSSQEYSSKVLQTIKDDTFWTSIKAKANSVFESAQLFIQNRIERDAQLVAALGIFAFDRIKKDVARALPSQSSVQQSIKKSVLQIAAQSSFVPGVDESTLQNLENETKTFIENENQNEEETSLYDEFNTPSDEIKEVFQSIKTILSGDTSKYLSQSSTLPSKSSFVSSSSRLNSNLRSIAPAGSISNAERQRRAYARQKATKLAREKDTAPVKLGRIAGSVTGTAYELTKEIQAETPGYKTKRARQALLQESNKVARVFLEGGGKQVWGRLTGQENTSDEDVIDAQNENTINAESNQSPDQNLETMVTDFVVTIDDVIKERSRLASIITKCLENPADTWIVQNVDVDKDALREVITAMVYKRDDLEVEWMGQWMAGQSLENAIDDMRGTVKSITALAAMAAGVEASDLLKEILIQDSKLLSNKEKFTYYAENEGQSMKGMEDDDGSMNDYLNVLSNDEMLETRKIDTKLIDIVTTNDLDANFASYDVENIVNDNPMTASQSSNTRNFVDVDVGMEIDATTPYYADKLNTANNDIKSNEESWDSATQQQSKSPVIEIVGDDEEIFLETQAESIPMDNLEKDEKKETSEDNILVVIILRSIDIVFFIVEKVVLVSKDFFCSVIIAQPIEHYFPSYDKK